MHRPGDKGGKGGGSSGGRDKKGEIVVKSGDAGAPAEKQFGKGKARV